MRNALAWALAGLISGVLLGLSDTLVLALTARSMFFDAFELARAAAWSVCISAGTGILVATFTGLLVSLFVLDMKRSGWWQRPLRVVSAAAGLFAVAMAPVLWSLTSGPRASQIAGRTAIVAIAACVLGIAAGAVVVLVLRWSQKTRRRKTAVALAASAVFCLSCFLDVTVLVRLYPLFHILITFFGLVVLTVGLRVWMPVPTGNSKTAVAGALLLTALVAGAFCLHAVRGSQNARFVIGERAPHTGDLIRLAKKLLPLPPEKSLDIATPEPEKEAGLPMTVPAVVRPGASVFLITVDAMRYDRLAVLGAKRRVAPNLDKLAARSVVFSRAYTPIPHTSYAISSLLTGKYTRRLMDVPGAPRRHETWPEIMHRFRYETAAFFTPAVFFIDRALFEPYFRSGCGFNHRKVEYLVPPDMRVGQVVGFLEASRGQRRPVFVWVHFFEPHEPYDTSCTRFGERPLDRYDCEISKVDEALGRLLSHLDEHYPEAIVIAASDHGEEFGEHGGLYHGTTLYDEQVRVPLVFHVPGLEPRVVDEPVSLVDLLGTVLAILDIPVPARVRSRDLSGLLVGNTAGMRAFAEVHERMMVATGDHKLICALADDLCRLYDLKNDPSETRSAASQYPEITARLKAELMAWAKGHARFELRPVETEEGTRAWPQAIREALRGQPGAAQGLVAVLREDGVPEVRRKAAELLYQMRDETPLKTLHLPVDKKDPVVAAWLASALAEQGDAEASAILARLSSELERLEPVWLATAIARLSSGDPSAARDVMDVALFEAAGLEQRVRALRLIAKTGQTEMAHRMIPLVNEYQMTLEAVHALGKLRHAGAIEPLTKRLFRERFIDRRAAIILALGEIGGARAVSAIARDLTRGDPTPGALGALVDLGAASTRGRIIELPAGKGDAALWSPAPKTSLRPGFSRIKRVVLRTSAAADGGSVAVMCRNQVVGRVRLFSGDHEGFVDLGACYRDGYNLPWVGLSIEPEGTDAQITAAAVVGSLYKEDTD